MNKESSAEDSGMYLTVCGWMLAGDSVNCHCLSDYKGHLGQP